MPLDNLHHRPLSSTCRSAAWVVVVVLVATACDRGPRTVTISIPNTPTAEKAGAVEQTKFADKVVTSNWTPNRVWNCIVFVGAHQAEITAIAAGETVTTMRTRFKPYIEAEAFLAERERRMECDAPTGRAVVHFPYKGTFTAPADALKRR